MCFSEDHGDLVMSFKSCAIDDCRKDDKTSISNNARLNNFCNSSNTFELEHVAFPWIDEELNGRVSVHFQAESGQTSHKTCNVRVLTSGKELAISRETPRIMLSMTESLITTSIPSDCKDIEKFMSDFVKLQRLKRHSKFIAHNQATANVTKRKQEDTASKAFHIKLPMRVSLFVYF